MVLGLVILEVLGFAILVGEVELVCEYFGVGSNGGKVGVVGFSTGCV